MNKLGFFSLLLSSIAITTTAAAQNVPPVAQAGPPEMVVMDSDNNGSQQVTLDGSQSSDADGTIASYSWTMNSEVKGTSASLSISLPVGEHLITLTVTDNNGASGQDAIRIFVGDPTNGGNNRIAIRNKTLPVFVSGLNLAWANFAMDLTNLDEAFMIQSLDKIKDAGGNAMRWWLHTNGLNSPIFSSDGRVIGINPQDIINMRRVLDLAHERGIVISMCLWSFDMLQSQGQNQTHMKQLVENKTMTQTYIDKALIPILEEVGDHPAVMTWEIFNEPEGMTELGWTPVKTQMKFVQQFVNLVAGTIRRTVPGAMISNGSWSFRAMTDKNGNTNYYRDDRLIAAGGDPDGTLDFYQIHYYPQHFNNNFSPFHRPASYWGLDKPIVIGEFPLGEVGQQADPDLSMLEAFQRAIDFGYAGAMPWSITDKDYGPKVDTAIPGLNFIRENYADDVEIPMVNNLNVPPTLKSTVPDVNIAAGSSDQFPNVLDLKTYFEDEEDGTNLAFSVVSNTDESLASLEISADGKVSVFLPSAKEGRAELLVRARDTNGKSAWGKFAVNVRNARGNLALFKPVTASSTETGDNIKERVNDGDKQTRWSSVYENNQHVVIDLEAKIAFDKVVLFWESAYGKSYEIQVSDDANAWATVFSTTNSNGGEDVIEFDMQEARYVKMNGLTRATSWGFSLYEFEVYNSLQTSNDEFSAAGISLYPNPTKGEVNIKSDFPVRAIRIANANGKIVHTSGPAAQIGLQQLKNVAPGIYFVHLNVNGKWVVKKLAIASVF